MTLTDQIALFSVADGAGLAFFVASWVAVGIWIERDSPKNRSVSMLMAEHRREWMRQMLQRDVRIFDAQIAASLRQGTSFLASTSLLAIGGVVALMGSPAPIAEAAEAVGRAAPIFVWQVKLVLVALILTSSFLRFVWSNRLFGYTSVLMGAVPSDPTTETAQIRADQAAEMGVRAAFNFNRGLRSMYFAIGALAWLAGVWALVGATCLVLWVIWQREFLSIPHRILTGKHHRGS
ncbi:MAG: DUF599 domain-containing protein [Pseudomonadota bacterium]